MKGRAGIKKSTPTVKQKADKARAAKVKRVAAQKVEICERIATGETLQAVCRDKRMPQWRTVYHWMDDDDEFSANIARARETGYDAIAQNCFDIADTGTNDYMATQTGEGADAYRLNGENIQRSKLRIETRLKLLACWSPKKYGQRKIHQGDDGADKIGVQLIISATDADL